MSVNVKIIGAQDIKNALLRMYPKEANKISKAGTNAGAALLAKELRRAAPRGPRGAAQSEASKKYGPLHKKIKHRRRRSRGNNHAAGVFIFDAYYWRMVEYGYKRRTKSGKVVEVAAHPFITPTWRQYRQKALDQIMHKMRERIEKLKAN